MKTFERDGFSIRVKVNGGKIFYCLYDITKSLNIGSKGGTSIKEAIERAFKRKISKVRIGNDDFSFVDEEQLEHFLRLYSTSADFNAFIREIPYWHKSQEAKEVIAKESQVAETQAKSVPSVVGKEVVSANVVESQVQLFNCDLGEVRVIIENNEPFFCLADLAKSLDFRDGTSLKRSINAEFEPYDFKSYPLQTRQGIQKFSFVGESELYFVIMRSKSEKAKAFRQWITKEVLPSIRKTGSYQVEQKPAIPQTYAEALLEAGRLALENEKLQAQAIENAPKVVAYDKLMDTHNSISVKEFGKIIGMGEKNLFKWLRESSYLMSDNKPYQRYIDRGYFEVVEKTCDIDDSRSKSYTQTLITPKGQGYLSNKIKGEKNERV